MKFQSIENNHYTLIKSLVEKLDSSNAQELKDLLNQLNKKNINKFIIDLSQTKYSDSSGLSALLIGNRLCKDTNGVFVLSGLQANVNKLISISQLDKVLVIKDDLNQAIDHMNL
jgi:anti-anti-sigma factor